MAARLAVLPEWSESVLSNSDFARRGAALAIRCCAFGRVLFGLALRVLRDIDNARCKIAQRRSFARILFDTVGRKLVGEKIAASILTLNTIAKYYSGVN